MERHMELADALTTIFRHNLWANLRLIELCAGLTAEQLATATPGAYGSIRDTLAHIASAERLYFSLISTGRRPQRPAGAPPLTMAQLLESARITGASLSEWAPRVQAGDTVPDDWYGVPYDLPKTILLTQAINHATEHRAQVMVLLTQLGIEPPDLQGWTYFDEQVIPSTRGAPHSE